MEKRDITFRAWDGEIMLHYEPQTTEEYCGEWVEFFFKKCHVMQFTGTYDRNNKPVYEGDILKNSDRDCVGVVTYYAHKAYFNVTDNYPDTLYNCEMLNVAGDGWMTHEIEVIGNVYETPALCEGN